MYWDPIKSTYIPVSSSGTATEPSNVSDTTQTSSETTHTSLANPVEIELPAEKPSSSKNETKSSKPMPKTAAQIAKVILLDF
jgi:hypothetical protein